MAASVFIGGGIFFSLMSRVKKEMLIAATPEKLHMHDACILPNCRSASHRQKLVETNALKYLSAHRRTVCTYVLSSVDAWLFNLSLVSPLAIRSLSWIHGEIKCQHSMRWWCWLWTLLNFLSEQWGLWFWPFSWWHYWGDMILHMPPGSLLAYCILQVRMVGMYGVYVHS